MSLPTTGRNTRMSSRSGPLWRSMYWRPSPLLAGPHRGVGPDWDHRCRRHDDCGAGDHRAGAECATCGGSQTSVQWLRAVSSSLGGLDRVFRGDAVAAPSDPGPGAWCDCDLCPVSCVSNGGSASVQGPAHGDTFHLASVERGDGGLVVAGSDPAHPQNVTGCGQGAALPPARAWGYIP